jgi:hypothetical protein
MSARPQYVGTLVAALAIFAGTGFAEEPMGAYSEPVSPSMTTTQDTSAPPAASEESTADASAIESNADAGTVAATPVQDNSIAIQRTAATESLNVYGQRKTEDEFISQDVMNALQNDSRIHGRIGVETFRHVVTLTGRVSTPGQVDRAGSVARSAVARDVEIRNDVRSIVS